jgi:hypothetical protein
MLCRARLNRPDECLVLVVGSFSDVPVRSSTGTTHMADQLAFCDDWTFDVPVDVDGESRALHDLDRILAVDRHVRSLALRRP